MTSELSAAMTQVRAGWRIVYAWTRRCQDLVHLVHQELGGLKFEFVEWSPDGYRQPGLNRTPYFARGTWAWDLLPAFSMRWVWRRTLPDGRVAEAHLYIRADDGWNKAGGGEPDPSRWKPVEETQTLLHLYVYVMNGIERPNLELWSWLDDGDEQVWNQVRSWTSKDGAAGAVARAIVLELDLLEDAAAVDTLLFGPARAWAAEAGMDGG